MAGIRNLLTRPILGRTQACRATPVGRTLAFEPLESRRLLAVTARFAPTTGVLTVLGDSLDNTITVSRNAAGAILVNSGAVAIVGGVPTVANTTVINLFGLGGTDALSLSETNGALPRAKIFGGSGNDNITGGSGNDFVFGQSGLDTLNSRGGFDLLFGGSGDDNLTGGDADDQAFGQSGNDRMTWNPGDDTDLNEGGTETDIVEVIGGGGAEVFTTTANGTRVRFDRLDPAPFFLDIGTSESLVVNANGGNDSFSATGNLAALIQITVDGGIGDDTLLGSNGIDLLMGGDNNDFIDGQQGNDVAFLGLGDDTFQWDPGDGSDTVEGQDGVDRLLFNGSAGNETFQALANGGRVRVTRDLGSITMDINDVERLDLNALSGTDVVTIGDLAGTDLVTINIALASTIGGSLADGQIDSVVITGTAGEDIVDIVGSAAGVTVSGLSATVSIFTGEAANDRVTVLGLAGDDAIDATGVAAGSIALTLDGGNDDDALLGGGGADILLGGAGDDVLIGGPGADILDGGLGDNILIQD